MSNKVSTNGISGRLKLEGLLSLQTLPQVKAFFEQNQSSLNLSNLVANAPKRTPSTDNPAASSSSDPAPAHANTRDLPPSGGVGVQAYPANLVRHWPGYAHTASAGQGSPSATNTASYRQLASNYASGPPGAVGAKQFAPFRAPYPFPAFTAPYGYHPGAPPPGHGGQGSNNGAAPHPYAQNMRPPTYYYPGS